MTRRGEFMSDRPAKVTQGPPVRSPPQHSPYLDRPLRSLEEVTHLLSERRRRRQAGRRAGTDTRERE